MGDGGLWGWYGFCVCFLICRHQVVVQLIWVVVGCGLWAVTVVVLVGCGGDGRWWLSVLLRQWILVVGGCAVDVVAVVDDNEEEIIYYFNV